MWDDPSFVVELLDLSVHFTVMRRALKKKYIVDLQLSQRKHIVKNILKSLSSIHVFSP